MVKRVSVSSLWMRILLGSISVVALWILFSRFLSEETNSVSFSGPHNVRVEVYYEVLCPDSRYFVLHQLYPTWQKIGNVMDIYLKPFGKASYKQSPRGYTFNCQHGPAECEGNMVHACAVKHIAKSSLLMEYIKCMITDNYDPKASGSKCAKSLGIDWPVIEHCVDSREGQDLLVMYGDDTHSLRPKLSFVPTIVLNGSQNNQKDILKNLLLQICKIYNGPKPDNCLEIV